MSLHLPAMIFTTKKGRVLLLHHRFILPINEKKKYVLIAQAPMALQLLVMLYNPQTKST